MLQIITWINSALSDPATVSPSSSSSSNFNLPTLVVSQDVPDDMPRDGNDFSPTMTGTKRQSTITLTNSKMTRAQLSMIDLAGFNDRFGSIGPGTTRGLSSLVEGGVGRASQGGTFDWERETGPMGEEDEVF